MTLAVFISEVLATLGILPVLTGPFVVFSGLNLFLQVLEKSQLCIQFSTFCSGKVIQSLSYSQYTPRLKFNSDLKFQAKRTNEKETHCIANSYY